MRGESVKHLSHKGRRPLDGGGVLLEASVAKSPIDLRAVFGNDRPVELEIGCGKGTFILRRARDRPEINLLGIEYARAYALYCADRLRRAGSDNARVIAADANDVVGHLPGGSLLRVHVYFPDPWPKRKHHRRRLIQPPFVTEVRRVLTIGGQLIIVTDHREYFEQIRRVLAEATGFAQINVPSFTGDAGERVGTNFERKYLAEGRPVFATAQMRYA